MEIKQLFKEDDAVSPVIGVILMVAITVILAAVIASFVLGLGDTADEVQPTSTFSFDTDTDAEQVTVTLTDGDTVEFDEIVLRGDAITEEVPLTDSDVYDSADIGDEWDVGQSVTIGDGDGDIDINEADTSSDWEGDDGEIRIIWEELDGDNSATLSTQEVPTSDF